MLSKNNSLLHSKLRSASVRKIFAGLLLMLFLFADSFNTDVFAKKKAGKSSRRSAGSSKKSKKSGKSSRRSASSSKRSSRRSASSSSRSSRRSAFSSRTVGGAGSGQSGSRHSAKSVDTTDLGPQTYGLSPCPIGATLWQNPDEERDDVYYKSKKTACYLPENTEANDWKKDSKDDKGNNIVKPVWIDDGEAVILSCEAGFLKSVKDKKSVCVEESSFCPLNKQVVERKGKIYINAATEEECSAPNSSIAVKLTKDQLAATGYEIKVGKAFYLYCKDGYYSEENGVKCGRCPASSTAIQGKNIGKQSCKPCESGFVKDESTGKCEKKP